MAGIEKFKRPQRFFQVDIASLREQAVMLRIALTVFVTLSSAMSGALAASHCKPSEEIVFSCHILKSAKAASLCATSRVTNGIKKTTALTYRFGKPSNPEFEFPSSSSGSLEKFRLSHYFRAGLDSTGISFATGSFLYSIYDTRDSEGATHKEVRTAGLSVSSDKQKKGAEFVCEAGSVVSNWAVVDGAVPCDEEDEVPNSCEYYPR